jgi:peptide/nickel transport system permease protein
MTTRARHIEHESYWQRIWRRFCDNSNGVVALGVIVVLFILAALAPFIANSHALMRIHNGSPEFPIFRSLEPIEWRFLVYVPLAGLVCFLRVRRRSWLPLVLAVVVVALTELTLFLTHPVNDPSNDRDFAGYKLMPPIPYSPNESSPDQFAPPSSKHWCGTDYTGRDIAARMVHGARTSLSIGFVAVSIALLVGVSVGGLAGYYRGWLDIGICRFIEILDCFPPLLLILVVIGVFDSQNNMFVIMAVIGLTSWTGLARLVRGEFLRLVGQPFPQAAKALGAGDAHIIVRHLLPNALGPILVSATFGVASAILIESSLSFLGFGMQAPTPSWGDILSDARIYIDFAWWLAFFPGLAILITIMSYNFVGEALRDAVDPRLRLK